MKLKIFDEDKIIIINTKQIPKISISLEVENIEVLCKVGILVGDYYNYSLVRQSLPNEKSEELFEKHKKEALQILYSKIKTTESLNLALKETIEDSVLIHGGKK
ncbi:hypothetical protein LS70_003765 [Helicobacter sp. MIT 11-5569]|uniref:hypothetical protein n=1 Tax=Helicobacter sp. MIT 11-5569 TaxID=1548151 RepID=UPI00051FB574|nr:hypothetical protein [Helicobacter sp. MIT 11-5569]TLD83935.1 hypothetical protein LS70_003765 [Helicobacter sp. MIT 11-5569]